MSASAQAKTPAPMRITGHMVGDFKRSGRLCGYYYYSDGSENATAVAIRLIENDLRLEVMRQQGPGDDHFNTGKIEWSIDQVGANEHIPDRQLITAATADEALRAWNTEIEASKPESVARQLVMRESTDTLINLVMLLTGGSANPNVVRSIAERIKSGMA